MSSCILLSRIKGRLAEEKNILVIGVITFCYFFGIILSINGLIELYKSNTFIIHHCQVKSIDLDIQKSNFYPRWNITVTDKNETRNDTIISSTRFSSEECAWNKAHQYKINKTYLCYRSQNQTIIPWNWQWNKPSKINSYIYLFSGIILLFIGLTLSILTKYYQTQFQSLQQQQQITLSSVEQQQTCIPTESPPPTYDEAVQSIRRQETRI